MAFERYLGYRRSRPAAASLWQRGQIGLNQQAIADFGLRQFPYVVLLYDAARRWIGLQFTTEPATPGATTCMHTRTAVVISARQFLAHYQLEAARLRRYPLAYDEGEGLYVIDLARPLERTCVARQERTA